MIVVLDVSAAMALLLKKDNMACYRDTIEQASRVIAPDLYIPELSNVLWKYCLAGVITHEDCSRIVEDGISLLDDTVDSKELWKEALGEGIKNRHSVYDMLYAVLARRNDALLLTSDSRLASICRNLNIRIQD